LLAYRPHPQSARDAERGSLADDLDLVCV